MRPTPGIPALTSRASKCLSFVFLTPPATSHPRTGSRASCFSVVRVHSGAQVFSLVARALLSSRSQSGSSERTRALVFILDTHPFPGSGSQSVLSCVPFRESGRSPVQEAVASQHPSAEAPSPFCFSSDICVRIHGSPLSTSILSAEDVHL